jgi:hypothetical protein
MITFGNGLWNIALFGCGLMLLLFAPGCSRRPEGFVTVTGQLKNADGSPLTGVQGFVVFRPCDPQNPNEDDAFLEGKLSELTCRGWLGEDGQFELATFDESGAGVKPGFYKVVVDVTGGSAGAPAIPKRYTRYQTSPWVVEVLAGENKPFDFTVEKE